MSYIDDHHDDEMNELYLNKKHINSINQTEFIKILPAYVGCELNGSNLRLNGSMIDQYMVGDRDNSLILRSYKQLRDEEKIKLVEIIYESTHDWPNRAKQIIESFRGNRFALNIFVASYIEALNYLRSIGIDCDGILESEFGVRKTK